jgi:hypothetical protein
MFLVKQRLEFYCKNHYCFLIKNNNIRRHFLGVLIMKKIILLVAVVSIWSFAVVYAADEQPGKEPAQKTEPNISPAPAVAPGSQQQRPEMEQMREQARQRIRERMERRRQQAWRGGAVMDANEIAQRRGRIDANSVVVISDANAAKRREAAIERLLTQQEAKYRERLARLTRIRELAKEQGDAKTVEKVDKLIKQDVQLHQVKMQRMSRQKEMMGARRSRLRGEPGENLMRIEKFKDVNVPDANKNVVRPPLKK